MPGRKKKSESADSPTPQSEKKVTPATSPSPTAKAAAKAAAKSATPASAVTPAAPAFTDGVATCGAGCALGLGAEAASVPTLVSSLRTTRVIGVSAGTHHTLILADGGNVFSFGRGLFGRLGLGDCVDRSSPQRITALSAHHVIQVSAGGAHSLALTSKDVVLSWGSDSSLQLGHGNDSAVFLSTPKVISVFTDSNVLHVSAGGSHSLALVGEGMVVAWGSHEHGRLGVELTEPIGKPTVVEALPPVQEVAAGGAHSLFLGVDGVVYAAGWSECGQLGQGPARDACGRGGAGEAGTEGKEGKEGKAKKAAAPPPRAVVAPVAGLEGHKIVQVAAGYSHSLVLADDGAVFAFGSGTCGRLGAGDGIVTRQHVPVRVPLPGAALQIAAGYRHSVFLTRAGEVFAAGSGHSGRLGQGSDVADHAAPVRVPLGGRRAREVAAGETHSVVLVDDAAKRDVVKSVERRVFRDQTTYRKLLKECNELYLVARGAGTNAEPIQFGQTAEYKDKCRERDEFRARMLQQQ